MNAIRSVVRVLVCVVAGGTCTFAFAQTVVFPTSPFPRQVSDRQQLEGPAAASTEGDNRARVDVAFQGPASSDADSDAPAPDFGEHAFTERSGEASQKGQLDGCCHNSCNCPCPCFYGEIDVLFLKRVPRFASQPIIVDANTGETFLSTSNLDYNFDPGVRATFGMRICGGRALEFSYFGLFDGSATASTVSPGSSAFLIFPGNFAGNVFVDLDRARVDYSSRINSFEVNLPCCCGCCDDCGCDRCGDGSGCGFGRCQSIEWFTGFRYLNLDEELNIAAQRDINGGVENGAYNIRTINNLYGAQLGGRFRRTSGRFGWEATGSAGVFGNDSQQRQSANDFPNFPLRPTVSNSGGRAAFVGEGSLSALYRLNQVWNLKAGYTLFWVEGVALAPDQLDFDFASASGGSQLHNGGGLFLHGVNIGLEARW
jgi:hypothetical protein